MSAKPHVTPWPWPSRRQHGIQGEVGRGPDHRPDSLLQCPWTSRAAKRSTTLSQRMTGNWASGRATSSRSPTRSMRTGTRACCTASPASSRSATWRCWCLSRSDHGTTAVTMGPPRITRGALQTLMFQPPRGSNSRGPSSPTPSHPKDSGSPVLSAHCFHLYQPVAGNGPRGPAQAPQGISQGHSHCVLGTEHLRLGAWGP